MEDSILLTIKKLAGMDENYNAFDQDLLVAINSAFMILSQLGVGPDKPFLINGATEKWSDYSPDIEWIELVKSYIQLRVRLLFDPPTSGVLHEAVERQIQEFEWRLMVQPGWKRQVDENNTIGGDANDSPGKPME